MEAGSKHIRLKSLDIFRGVIVCMMLLVGASGNYAYTYKMLDHAPWSGFTPTDFIFPSFLFIIGMAQSLSFKPNDEKKGRLLKIARRSAILFALGVLINYFPFCFRDADGVIKWIPFNDIRIMGVLQRIALAFGISSLLEWYSSEKKIVLISALILITYFCLLYLGGSPEPYRLETNFVSTIDRLLLGDIHMYREQGIPFDPEGLLSTLPAIVNVLFGYLTGKQIQMRRFEIDDLLKVMMIGCALLVVGYLWSYQDPVNKKLWTTSFTLITIGLDMMLFIIVLYWTDIRRNKFSSTSFFASFGRNPVLIYLFSELLMKLLLFPIAASGNSIYAILYNHFFSGIGNYLGSLFQAITYVLLCWTLVWWLDRRKLYVKV